MSIRWIIAALIVGILSGCAHMKKMDPAEQLSARVAAHWQAKVDQRWGDAYDFFCSDQKSDADKKGYVASSNLGIAAFHVDDIGLSDDQQSATVTVVANLIVQGMTFPDGRFKDTWKYEDNDWCIAQRSGFNTLFKKP